MKGKRRNWSVALLFSLLTLVWFVSSPAFTKAIPPAGIRIWLFDRGPNIEEIVRDMVVLVHEPTTSADLFKVSTDVATGGYNSVNTLAELNAGDSVQITTFVWLKDDVTLLDVPVDTFMSYPTITIGSNLGQFIDNPDIHEVYNPTGYTPFLSDNPENHPTYGSFRGQLLKLPNIQNNNSGRPDIIFTYVYNTLPNPPGTSKVQYTIRSTMFKAGKFDPFIWAGNSFILIPKEQYVEVSEGNAFINNIDPAKKLVFTNPGGQTIVSNGSITGKCSWVDDNEIKKKCDNSLSWIGTHTFDPDSQASADAARVALRQSLSKAVQEVAQIIKNSSSAANSVKDFLESPQTGVKKVKYPNGEVLLVVGSGNLEIKNGDINVSGKKLVIFSGYSQVIWRNNINATPNSKLASIVLSGNQVFDNSGGGKANYAGAFIALDISSPYSADSRVQIMGSDDTATVTGLMVGDQIVVNRTVTAGIKKIAEIKYDAAYQNGELIGLSPFIRPLVSTGYTR